ncbi:MAG: hypothetical protein NTX50_01530 [Candidatus Sumerlaeota bacterium]|nr:hypothetical protein [Candidatus Sumerlaeota bacterium]
MSAWILKDRICAIIAAGLMFICLAGIAPGARADAGNAASGVNAMALDVPLTLHRPLLETVYGPVVNNAPATLITAASAQLNGNLISDGGDWTTSITIYWGQFDGGTNQAAWANSAFLGTMPVGFFSTPIAGLNRATTYYFRCYAQNSAGFAWAPVSANFTTLPDPPFVVNRPATNIMRTSAQLNGRLWDDGGSPTNVTFFWGLADGGAIPGNWDNNQNIGTVPMGNFNLTVTGLTAGTTYYFRCSGTNAAGLSWAAPSFNFRTSTATSLPSIANNPATNITTNSARLNGTLLDDGGLPTSVTVYWGQADGGAVPAFWGYHQDMGLQAIGAFFVDANFLVPGGHYFFSSSATNTSGTVWGTPSEEFDVLPVFIPSPTPKPTATPSVTPVATPNPSQTPTPLPHVSHLLRPLPPPSDQQPLDKWGLYDFSEGFGPGVSWAVANAKTIQESYQHLWSQRDLNTSPALVMSPYFLWNTGGSFLVHFAEQIMVEKGIPPLSICSALGAAPPEALLTSTSVYKALTMQPIFLRTPRLSSQYIFNGRYGNNVKTLKQVLDKNYAIVLGIPVYDGFQYLGADDQHPWPEKNVYDVRNPSVRRLIGYQTVTLVGYDSEKPYRTELDQFDKGAFLAMNSWGTSWGVTDNAPHRGMIWLSDYFIKNQAIEAWYIEDERPIEFSMLATPRSGASWRAETVDYVISYTGAGSLIATSGTGELQIRGAGAGGFGSIKITRKPHVKIVPPLVRKGLTPLLPLVSTDGGFTQVYTQGPIAFLQAAGEIRSVSASHCHIGQIIGNGIGSVRMNSDYDSSWPQLSSAIYTVNKRAFVTRYPRLAQTDIRTSATTAYTGTLRANVNLSGVTLHSLEVPGQTAAIVAGSRKMTLRGSPAYVSYSGIGPIQPSLQSPTSFTVVSSGTIVTTAAAILKASSLPSISVSGAHVWPDAMIATTDFSRMKARGIVFTTKFNKMSLALPKPSDIAPILLRAPGSKLSITASAGSVYPAYLIADGEITLLSARALRYRDIGTGIFSFLGGHVGTDNPLDMTVASGVGGAKLDMVALRGDFGVVGQFMAGATLSTSGTLKPKCSGTIRSITTLSTTWPLLPLDVRVTSGPLVAGTVDMLPGEFPSKPKRIGKGNWEFLVPGVCTEP